MIIGSFVFKNFDMMIRLPIYLLPLWHNLIGLLFMLLIVSIGLDVVMLCNFKRE